METNDLLLKARKGATASFETKQWTIVLEALGFKVATEKESRTVVKAIVTAPGGQSLTIVKEPHYRRIVWYDLPRWMKDQGFNLTEMASAVLGMDTPDEEKRLKHLYERDLTNTGTCGVCEGNFKRDGDGGLVLHGFTRPGDGMTHGRCFGVAYQPHEIAPDAAKDYLAQILRPYLAEWKNTLASLRADKVDIFYVKEWNHESRAYELKKVTRADNYEFQKARKAEIYQAECNVGWAAIDIVRFEKKVVAWKPDDLPEVKYAARK
jgi:hypothetical protein